MGKFSGILFCTDLDGTLLRNDKSISAENLRAIEYFKSEGGMFTFITGRLPDAAVDIYEEVNPNVPFGCINGGGVYDHRKKEFAWITTLPDEALDLVEYVDHRLENLGIQLHTPQGIYFYNENPEMISFRENTTAASFSCHYREVKEPIAKVVFADNEVQLMKLRELLHNHPKADSYDFIRSEHTLYEILPKGVTKATALLKLIDILHVDIKNTVTVGDYDNDVAMIRCAGRGYAVANASEAAKHVASRITVSNQEHAIAKIIEDLERECRPN